MTPTASAAPSVRARARARRAAPTSTSASRTPTDDTVTAADRRDGSRSFVPASVTPSISGCTATTSSPARRSSSSAAAPPRTIPASPSSTPSLRVSEPPRPTAATRLPSPSAGRKQAHCSSLPHCATTAEASTVGRNGPGATWRPSSSSTEISSLSPAPAPPYSSGRWMPSQPSSAISFQYEGRGSVSASSRARFAASASCVVSTSRTVARELLVLVGDGDRHPCPLCVVPAGLQTRAVAARHYRTGRLGQRLDHRAASPNRAIRWSS